MGRKLDRFLGGLAAAYIRFVYFTGKVTRGGRTDLLTGDETFAVSFWHGDNFCLFPLLKDRGDIVVTTASRRGNVLETLGRNLGYEPVRLPDESDPDMSLSGLRTMLAAAKDKNICISMDGPLGPYHVPKRFFLTAAVLLKKRVLPVSSEVRRKVCLTGRWDKYVVPLPFARIKITFHEPVEVRKNEFEAAAEEIVRRMDGDG